MMRVVAVGGDEVQVHEDGSVDVRGQQLEWCLMGDWPKGRDPQRHRRRPQGIPGAESRRCLRHLAGGRIDQGTSDNA